MVQPAQLVTAQPQVFAAIIGGAVAVIVLVVSTTVQVIFKWREARVERDREHIRLRREALHEALAVIDLTLENLPLVREPVRPEEWDERRARDAWNKMLLYCAYPGETVQRFAEAIRVTIVGGEEQTTLVTDPVTSLAAFRAQVRKELDAGARRRPEAPALLRSSDHLWIMTSPGSTSERRVGSLAAEQENPT